MPQRAPRLTRRPQRPTAALQAIGHGGDGAALLEPGELDGCDLDERGARRPRGLAELGRMLGSRGELERRRSPPRYPIPGTYRPRRAPPRAGRGRAIKSISAMRPTRATTSSRPGAVSLVSPCAPRARRLEADRAGHAAGDDVEPDGRRLRPTWPRGTGRGARRPRSRRPHVLLGIASGGWAKVGQRLGGKSPPRARVPLSGRRSKPYQDRIGFRRLPAGRARLDAAPAPPTKPPQKLYAAAPYRRPGCRARGIRSAAHAGRMLASAAARRHSVTTSSRPRAAAGNRPAPPA